MSLFNGLIEERTDFCIFWLALCCWSCSDWVDWLSAGLLYFTRYKWKYNIFYKKCDNAVLWHTGWLILRWRGWYDIMFSPNLSRLQRLGTNPRLKGRMQLKTTKSTPLAAMGWTGTKCRTGETEFEKSFCYLFWFIFVCLVCWLWECSSEKRYTFFQRKFLGLYLFTLFYLVCSEKQTKARVWQ